ncbi:MAG: hypothetical protein LBU79_05510 [Planctomycetota bacterium]|nr:hypothetical protein [Planctomycetota bacterium]
MRLLALLRLSRVFVALSAVLAGYGLFRFNANTAGNLRVVPYLLAAAALLAVADSAWGLIFQSARANRLPEGLTNGLSTGGACLVAGAASLAGLLCAMTGGYGSFRVAGILLVAILFRAGLFRHTAVISPLLAGTVTGLTLVLGMTAHPSFLDILNLREMFLPPVFYAVFLAVASVLEELPGGRRGGVPAPEELAGDTVTRLLSLRGDTVDRPVVWFGGGALALIPLVAAWVMPWRWLSWAVLGVFSLSILVRLIPVLVYRVHRDLERFVGASQRGGVFLNAGLVASLGDYRPRNIYAGWQLPLLPDDELALLCLMLFLAAPAWLLRNSGLDD